MFVRSTIVSRCSIRAQRLLSVTTASSSISGTDVSQSILLKSKKNGVLTLTMNSPKNLNAWSLSMLNEVIKGFKEGAEDNEIKVC